MRKKESADKKRSNILPNYTSLRKRIAYSFLGDASACHDRRIDGCNSLSQFNRNHAPHHKGYSSRTSALLSYANPLFFLVCECDPPHARSHLILFDVTFYITVTKSSHIITSRFHINAIKTQSLSRFHQFHE